jgi:hypothetical protein
LLNERLCLSCYNNLRCKHRLNKASSSLRWRMGANILKVGIGQPIIQILSKIKRPGKALVTYSCIVMFESWHVEPLGNDSLVELRVHLLSLSICEILEPPSKSQLLILTILPGWLLNWLRSPYLIGVKDWFSLVYC